MITTIATLVMDIGLGAIALRLARDLRTVVNLHEGRLGRLERHTGLALAPV